MNRAVNYTLVNRAATVAVMKRAAATVVVEKRAAATVVVMKRAAVKRAILMLQILVQKAIIMLQISPPWMMVPVVVAQSHNRFATDMGMVFSDKRIP